MKFNIECEMPDRWVPHFLGMLKRMQNLGSIGSSRHVKFYSDGDGDFRPKFKWDCPVEPAKAIDKDGLMFDAG